MSETPDAVIEWLRRGPPWVRFRTELDLIGRGDRLTRSLWQEARHDPSVRALMAQVDSWPWPRLTSHRSAAHPLHKLVFLADLGFSIQDEEMRPTVQRLLDSGSEEGPFQVTVNIGKNYGGTGQDAGGWALCDSPSLAYCMVRMGAGEEGRTRSAISHLKGLVRNNGWPCAVSKELGNFRGPGRKDDPCPYANLIMLKLLAATPSGGDGPEARVGVETLLALWSKSREQHPYMFFMGTDFRKLKVPYVWYDIMHVADVLTQFPWACNDRRLKDMVSLIESKKDDNDRFTPESIWADWKEWEFGQKKVPSRWLTLMAYRILARCPVG